MTTPKKKTSKNASGMGSIRLRTDGRWEARYTTGIHPGTGAQLQKSIYGKTQKEVRQKLQHISSEINNGTYTEPSKMTVGSWLEVWHQEYLANVKPSTSVSYYQHIKNHLKPALGALSLASLKPASIQKMYNDLSRSGLSPKTIKNIHGVFHKALQQATLLGYLRANPSTACILPRVTKADIHPLDSNQMAAFLQAIANHPLEALFKTALFTGMRIGEILGLTWDRVNFDKGTILIDRQLLRPRIKGEGFSFGSLKNDKPRTLSPASFVMDVLKNHKTNQLQQRLRVGELWISSPAYVFTNEVGQHSSYWLASARFKEVLTGISIEQRSFHVLRHTYAVSALRSGDDVKTVQSNLGHHTAAFTLDVYGHFTDEMRQDSSARMQAFIENLTAQKS